jgi:hypothetical protein
MKGVNIFNGLKSSGAAQHMSTDDAEVNVAALKAEIARCLEVIEGRSHAFSVREARERLAKARTQLSLEESRLLALEQAKQSRAIGRFFKPRERGRDIGGFER